MQVCISDWLRQQHYITASISTGAPHNWVFFLPPKIDVVRFCKMEQTHSPGFLLSCRIIGNLSYPHLQFCFIGFPAGEGSHLSRESCRKHLITSPLWCRHGVWTRDNEYTLTHRHYRDRGTLLTGLFSGNQLYK